MKLRRLITGMPPPTLFNVLPLTPGERAALRACEWTGAAVRVAQAVSVGYGVWYLVAHRGAIGGLVVAVALVWLFEQARPKLPVSVSEKIDALAPDDG